MNKERLLYLDVIKIIACFLVIVNHTNSVIFLSASPSPVWFLSVALFFLSKIAVPLFIMSSGAVILGKADPLKKTFMRVGRIVVVLIVFSFIFSIYAHWLNGSFQNFNPLFELFMVFKQPVTASYWYLYTYIGLLMLSPFLARMLMHFSNSMYLYFFVLSVLVPGVYPILTHVFPAFSVSSDFIALIPSVYVGLFVAGYFLHKLATPTSLSVGLASLLFLILLGLQIALTYNEYVKNSEDYLFYDNRTFITITLSSICVLYSFKFLFSGLSIKPFTRKIITEVSMCTFGIYLLSDIFISVYTPLQSQLFERINPIVAVLIMDSLVFITGLGVVYILRRVPLVKKFI